MLPKVVIIGRPNVGKSSLLNLLSGRLVSIVDPTPGVTRDRISTIIELPGETKKSPPLHVELIDTGGYGIAPPEDPQGLKQQIESQIASGVQEADLILFVTDAQTGVVPLDEQVAHWLREAIGGAQARVLMVSNKVDSPRHEPGAYEAMRLGFGEPVTVSAVSSYGHDDLAEAIRQRLLSAAATGTLKGELDAPAQADLGVLLAIVGKRNAGKSTLVNALAGQERVIVSELEGTTRDAVDVRFELDGQVFTAIDTAGVRKTKSLKGDIEYYSQHRALRAVRRADVILHLIDATVPVSQVDQQLSQEAIKHFKPAILVINKWDLASGRTTIAEYEEYFAEELRGLSFAPLAFISAKTGQGMKELVTTALSLYRQSAERISTSKLNDVFKAILAERPPTSGIGRRPKIYYVTQTDVRPPTIALFVNDPSMFTPMYQRYLLNRLRERLPFAEVPIRLDIRGKAGLPEDAPAETSTQNPRSNKPKRNPRTAPRARSGVPRARRPKRRRP